MMSMNEKKKTKNKMAMMKKVAVETESVSGGVDVWDADARSEKESFPEHLVFMVNGLGGSANDWRYAAEQFVNKFPNKVIVHRSECNYSRLTFDGVDFMGERLAEEVLSVINRRKGVRKISFVAHSLGGLIARYAIGRLYDPEMVKDFGNYNYDIEEQPQSTVAGLEPINFITVATPHLGSRGNKQLPFLCGLPFLERSVSQTAHLFVGRTGRHLFLTDNDNGKPPLLLRMAGNHDELKFRSALGSFKRRVAYANTNFDSMVGWRTSSIRRQHELPEPQLLVKDEKYPHIVYVDRGNTQIIEKEPFPDSGIQTDHLEEEMIKGLAQVPWERVDVSFKKSNQRYVAHTTIQVKTYWLNSDGADVVVHMIDNFLV